MHTLQKLTVKNVRKETQDSVVVDFDISGDKDRLFGFKAGQYLTLQAHINGQPVRRAYSICSAPDSGRLQVGIKHIVDGVFSTYANTALKAGDVLEVLPPQGHFVLPHTMPTGGNYLMVCAGSGITPILSLIKHILTHDTTANITLIYGNRYSHSIMFKETLVGLKNRYLSQFNIIHVLSREEQRINLRSGRIDGEKITHITQAMLRQGIDQAFVCGPQQIVEMVQSVCTDMGMPKQNIHFELFGTPHKQVNKKPTNTGKKHQVSIIKSGATTRFEMDTNEGNILAMGRTQGTDLPFACKAGVCSTCKCQVITGKAHMDVNYALTDEEVAQGFVLSCQAYPVSPIIVVDFDV